MDKCLGYLEKVDERLILQICKYAENYLNDILINTSIGELYYDEEEPFPHDDLLGMLQYFSFEILYIDEPPQSMNASFEVLNLYGGCDWQEDEGIQCLVKKGEVIFLGGYNNFSVWKDYSKDYIGNYVLYEKRSEFSKIAAKQIQDKDNWKSERFTRWIDKGIATVHKLECFADEILAVREDMEPKKATIIFEDTYLFQMMEEYSKLLEESLEFWYKCYCVEKEEGIGELVKYISETCQWNLF